MSIRHFFALLISFITFNTDLRHRLIGQKMPGRARAPATKGSGPQTSTLNYPAPRVCGPPLETPELVRRFGDQDEARTSNVPKVDSLTTALEARDLVVPTPQKYKMKFFTNTVTNEVKEPKDETTPEEMIKATDEREQLCLSSLPKVAFDQLKVVNDEEAKLVVKMNQVVKSNDEVEQFFVPQRHEDDLAEAVTELERLSAVFVSRKWDKLPDGYTILGSTRVGKYEFNRDQKKVTLFAFCNSQEMTVILKIGTKPEIAVRIYNEYCSIQKLQKTEVKNAKTYLQLLSNEHVGLPIVINNNVSDLLKGKKLHVDDTIEPPYFICILEVGDSLEIVHKRYGQFSNIQVAKVALQMLDLLEFIHGIGYIHRDIQPSHVVLSGDLNTENYKLTLIGFSVMTSYLDKNNKHVGMAKGILQQNDYRSFCSANRDKRTMSRRDDIEMLALMLVDLSRSKLPWGAFVDYNKDRKRARKPPAFFWKLMNSYRMEKPEEKYFQFQDCNASAAVKAFLSYARKLEFGETPKYEAWKAMFRKDAGY